MNMVNNQISQISIKNRDQYVCEQNSSGFLSLGDFLWLGATSLVLIGCATQPPVPVIDRSNSTLASTVKPAESNAPNNQMYIVQKGDTLYSISLNHGIDARKLAEWNNITDPKMLKPGQRISLSAPSEQNVARLKNSPDSTLDVSAPPAAQATEIAKQTRFESAPQPVSQQFDKSSESTVAQWIWPTTGAVMSTFSKNSKGVKISGQAGQPVVASAAGEVVYSGHGLRGYGNLIIIKHNNTFLSAYAHNSKLLVKEGEAVSKGQKIAEMGNTDTDIIQLHFEIRKNGKPVDPMEYLPSQS